MNGLHLVAPSTPVEVAAGEHEIWPVGLKNGSAACRVRLSATGAGAAWLNLPVEVAMGPGESREIALHLTPDADAGPVGGVVPLIVHAHGDGDQSASVAAVVVLTAGERVAVALATNSRTFVRRTTVGVSVRAQCTRPTQVTLGVDPRDSCLLAEEVLNIEPGGTAHTLVQIRRPVRWWGAPRTTVVTVTWRDAGEGEASATVTQVPVLVRRVFLGAATALVLGLIAGLLALQVLR